MNQMMEWKSGRTEPGQEIKYRKAHKHEIDDLVFLSRVISVIAEKDHTEFVFLKPDFVSFISVKYYENGLIEVGEWTNKENPYIYIFRNKCGQLQSGIDHHE